jgi:DNA-binding LacI/PurR family transcriptional regulator
MVPIHLTNADFEHYVSQTQIPFVVLAEYVTHPNIDVIFLNAERAMHEATRWLITERGYRDFGYIGVADSYPSGPRRFRGFSRALEEAGLTLDARFKLEGDFSLESGRRAAHALIALGELPSALVVVNDLMAIGVILALQEAGYSVPEDVAVMGFDNIPEASIVRPRLTTVAQDPRDMGEKMAKALFERIENPDIATRRVLESPFRLIPREST